MVTHMEVRRGVPDEYVQASRRIVGTDQMEEWAREVRATIEEMMVITIITIIPTWIKGIDFERAFPGPRRG
jgi:hypothetical protein